MPRRQPCALAASGENIAGIVLFEKQQALKAEIQDLEKLKLSSKHTVDQLLLELTQARAEAENLKRAIKREGSSNTIAAEVSRSRMLHPAPETPWAGGFESPTVAFIEVHRNPVNGTVHIHAEGVGVMESPTEASTETRRDPIRGQRISMAKQWELK